MPLSMQHAQLLDRAVVAAEKAAACIMEYYGRDLTIWSKGIGTHTGDVVTEADHAAQEIIIEELFGRGFDKDPLLADIAVLAEEMPDYHQSLRFEKNYTFLIDPLDGTRGFLDHTNSFAVAIGLIEKDGTPVFGVVHLPAYQRCYVGIHQTSCTQNGQAITAPPLGENLTLLVSEAEIFAPEKNAVWHRVCDEIKRRTSVRKIRPQVIGSPIQKGCLTVANESPALYLGLPRAKKGVSLWDLAATAPIVSGAGGVVCDAYGHPLELNRRESIYAHHKGFLYASHREIADAALAALAREGQLVF